MGNFKTKWSLDRQKFLSEAEIRKLKRVVEDKALADLQKGRTTWVRFWMVVDLAINTGMRVSEIASLKIGGLFLSAREPRINVTGKGQRTRDVYIAKELRKHLTTYLIWKRSLDEPTEKDDFLLISSHGKPYAVRALQYAFKVCLKESGLPSYYSIHACRHSYGTYLYQKTKDLRLVQKQLGHASITTTTVYSDVIFEEILEAVNGLYRKDDKRNGKDSDGEKD